jgi:O-antigen ligase
VLIAATPASRIARLTSPPHTGRFRLRTVTALQLALVGLAIGNLGRIPVFSTGGREAPILLNDLTAAIAILAGAIAALQARRLIIDTTMGWAAAFAAVGALSALLAVPRFGISLTELVISLAYLIRWLFYLGMYAIVVNCLAQSDVVRLLNALRNTILALALFGIVQSILLPDFAQMVYPESRAYVDWDPQGHRLVSTMLDPNFAGALVLLGLLVEVSRVAFGASAPHWRLLVLVAALLMTASRSSLLAMLVGGLVVLAARGVSRRMIRVGLAVLLLVAVSLPQLIRFAASFNKLEIDASALARVVVWGRGLTVFADHPIIGIGFNTWGYVQEWYGWERIGVASYSIEGGLLFVAVMSGLLGLAIYLGMLWTVVARSRRLWRNPGATPDARALGAATAASVIAMLVHSMFSNSLFFPFILVPLWMLWGLAAVAHRHGTDPVAR